MANFTQLDFRYGMVSEKLRRRSDLSMYQNSASLIENAVPLRTGGVKQREGLRRFRSASGVAVEGLNAIRVIPLTVNATQSYVLAFSATDGEGQTYNNIKIYNVRAQAEATALRYTLTNEQINEMTFAQNYEMIVFAHKTMNPFYIQINHAEDGSIGFSLEKFTPYTTQDVYVDGSKDSEASIGIPAYQYENFIPQDNYPSGVSFVANRLCFYNFKKTPYGLFMSKPFEYTNFQETVLYRASVSGISKPLYLKALELQGSTTSEKGTQTGKNGTSYPNCYKKTETTVSTAGYYITTVTIVDADTAELKESYVRTRKYSFKEDPNNPGSWTKTDLGTYDDSAVYYATESYKYSKVITDDCAIRLELSSDRDETICWLGQCGEYIFAGTTSSEWIMPYGMTATSVSCSKVSSYGSSIYTHCAYGMRNIYHVQAGGKKIRTLQYSNNGTSFTELTYPIPELFSEGISAIAWQRVPEPRIYALSKVDPHVINVMCYDVDYGVSAWCKWTFSDEVKSLCVVDTEDGQEVVVLYGDKICMFVDGIYVDATDTIPFIPKLITNNIESYSVIANGKRSYSIMADTDGTPFSACSFSPATNKATPFVCRKVNAQLSKVEAYTPYPSDQGLRVMIQGKGGVAFTLLALVTDVEVG